MPIQSKKLMKSVAQYQSMTLLLQNKPLSNIELYEAIKKLKITQFRGVFVRDKWPKEAN